MKSVEEIEKYIESVRHEVNQLGEHYTGRISFELNFRDGGVGNMNIEKGKSIRLSIVP
jgi:pyruvoyl-dependent arginine decarboxylase (PvlArgDC)